jgi:hypothetical protein
MKTVYVLFRDSDPDYPERRVVVGYSCMGDDHSSMSDEEYIRIARRYPLNTAGWQSEDATVERWDNPR